MKVIELVLPCMQVISVLLLKSWSLVSLLHHGVMGMYIILSVTLHRCAFLSSQLFYKWQDSTSAAFLPSVSWCNV